MSDGSAEMRRLNRTTEHWHRPKHLNELNHAFTRSVRWLSAVKLNGRRNAAFWPSPALYCVQGEQSSFPLKSEAVYGIFRGPI